MLTKSIGTQNPINLVKATMEGLMGLRRPEQVAKLRGLSVNQVLGIQKNGTKGERVESEAAQGGAVEAGAAEGGSAEGGSGTGAAEGGSAEAERLKVDRPGLATKSRKLAAEPAAPPEPKPAGNVAEGEASGGVIPRLPAEW